MRENLVLAKKLFKTAENDLKAVEILYKAGNFNIALFQFQQSVEKFVKSYGIRMEIIVAEDLNKKISHLPHKVFTKQYSNEANKLTEQENTPLLIADMIPPHQRGNEQTKEKIKGLEKLVNKINNINLPTYKNVTEQDLNKFIENAKDIELEYQFNDETIFNEMKDDFVKTHVHFIEYFAQFKDDFLINDAKKRLENVDDYVKNQVSNYVFKFRQEEKIKYISYVWLNLSLITAPHEQSTRYPDLKSEQTPENYYTIENIVIKFLPQFIALMKNSIYKFNNVFE